MCSCFHYNSDASSAFSFCLFCSLILLVLICKYNTHSDPEQICICTDGWSGPHCEISDTTVIIAKDDSYQIDPSFSVIVTNILSNDLHLAGKELAIKSLDEDGNGVFVDVPPEGYKFPGATGGEVTVNTNGKLEFDPGRDFDGLTGGNETEVIFDYIAGDNIGHVDKARVTITIIDSKLQKKDPPPSLSTNSGNGDTNIASILRPMMITMGIIIAGAVYITVYLVVQDKLQAKRDSQQFNENNSDVTKASKTPELGMISGDVEII